MLSRTAVISFAIILMLTSGCAVVHRYGPYYGKVIDSETKEPLEGVAVLIECRTQSYGPGGSNTYYVDARDTVSDKNGEYRIPAFSVWTFRPLQNFESYVWSTIFKPGYGYFPAHSRSRINSERPKNGVLPLNSHVTVELSKLKAEERFSSPSVNFDIPYKKQKKFIAVLNMWKEQIGSEKYTEQSFER